VTIKITVFFKISCVAGSLKLQVDK
jgi:hypothetical protein